jgi:hypothetical protein
VNALRRTKKLFIVTPKIGNPCKRNICNRDALQLNCKNLLKSRCLLSFLQNNCKSNRVLGSFSSGGYAVHQIFHEFLSAEGISSKGISRPLTFGNFQELTRPSDARSKQFISRALLMRNLGRARKSVRSEGDRLLVKSCKQN